MQKEMVSLTEREAILRNIPLFRSWSVAEIASLAGLMQEVYVEADIPIVTEGELIDSLYFLANGSAEITKKLDLKGKSGITFIGLLNKGESIGLKESGLFSESGERTATVTALVPCMLLKLDLQDFQQFLKTHPHLLQVMDKSLSEMLKMRFIKNAAPFSGLSNTRIAWLANQVREIALEAGITLFHEGDETDACYMVYEGRIEISRQGETGGREILAQLGPGELFGETALLRSEKRAATAKTLTPARLLVLDRFILQELTRNDVETSDLLVSLVMERGRPLRKENIIYQQRRLSDGQMLVLLKDSSNNNYQQLNEHGWHLWQLLNGQLSTLDIIKKLQKKFPELHSEYVLGILTRLIENDFVRMDALESDSQSSAKNRDLPAHFRILHFFKKADKKADTLYRYGAFVFFYRPVLAFLCLFGCSGLYFFIQKLPIILESLSKVSLFPLWILTAFACFLFLRLLNPLFRIVTIKHFKHEIPQLAFLWQGFAPQIYVDNSDLMMGDQKSRTAVDFSGILSYVLIAACLSLIVYASKDPGIFLWLIAFLMYMEILRILNPMLDQEGYLFLMDILDTTNLRESAFRWMLNRNSQPKNHRSIMIFWIYAFIYLLLLLGSTYWFINTLKPVIPFINDLELIFAILVSISYILQMVLEIRHQKKINQLVEMV